MSAIAGVVMRRRAGLADRARGWLRNGPTGLVAIALGIGVGGGLGAIAFRYLILWFTRLFSGHDDYSAAGHAAHPWFPGLGPWFVVLVPVIGGLMYDRRRQQYLGRLSATAPRSGAKDYAQQRRPHLRAVQRMVLERMRREEAIPLGIEFSAMHQYIAARHHLRPDALMLGLDPQRLIYVEYLRKAGERELSLRGQGRYDRMRETLKTPAGALEVDVLLDYRSKGEEYELLYEPGRLGVRRRELQLVGGAEQAALFSDDEEVIDLPEDPDWDRV